MPSASGQGAKISKNQNSKDTNKEANANSQKNKRQRRRHKKKNTSDANPQIEEQQIATEDLNIKSETNPINKTEIALSEPKPEQSTGNPEKMASAVTKASPPIENPVIGNSSDAAEKTREQIKAEREAKKLAKQKKKTKPTTAANDTATITPTQARGEKAKDLSDSSAAVEKPREQIMAEREAKKSAKCGDVAVEITQPMINLKVGEQLARTPTEAAGSDQSAADKKKPALSKAERRALQEAQRAAKAQAQTKKAPAVATTKATANAKAPPSAALLVPGKATATATTTATSTRTSASPTKKTKTQHCQIKLFNHLECASKGVNLFINNTQIHPSISRLGEQYAKRTIVGSNARCIAFLNALKMVVQDYETPPKKEFARSLETSIKNCVDHLQKCRPLAVSVSNAYKHIKHVLTQLPSDKTESELKESLCHFVDTYIENQIGKAAQAISSYVQEKITNGDVILTFGCSSLINYICEEAHRRHVDFRVIVVDSRPFCEGQELLRRLTARNIPCTYVLINAVGFVMPEATKVLLGAHALLSNGYVMSRTGTAQVALVARSFNVPVLVCCETHKFSERFQTDAIVYNELGNPDDLILSDKCSLLNWQAKDKMTPLNLIYDITPPELVTAVVTEVSILPCTSVPVILRIKPTEIGYYS